MQRSSRHLGTPHIDIGHDDSSGRAGVKVRALRRSVPTRHRYRPRRAVARPREDGAVVDSHQRTELQGIFNAASGFLRIAPRQ